MKYTHNRRRKILVNCSAWPPLTPGKRRKLHRRRRRRRKRKNRKKNMLLVPLSIPEADRLEQTPVPAPRDRPRRPKLLRPPAHGTSTRSERNAIKSKCSRPPEKEPGPYSPELRKFQLLSHSTFVCDVVVVYLSFMLGSGSIRLFLLEVKPRKQSQHL
jgi:hypothetical protein